MHNVRALVDALDNDNHAQMTVRRSSAVDASVGRTGARN